MKSSRYLSVRAGQPQEEVNHHTSSFFLLPFSLLKKASSFFLLPFSFLKRFSRHTSSFFLLPSSFLKRFSRHTSSFFLLPSSFSPGFTIIELLVASLLLGMLMTILTMVFNQSSISWRTGMAGLVDMGVTRSNLAEVRDEADNAFISNGKLHRITGLWNKNGDFRDRACDAPNSDDYNENRPGFLMAKFGGDSGWANYTPKDYDMSSYSISGSGSARSAYTYTVNVKSAGPNKIYDDWDDIWSFPDDFE